MSAELTTTIRADLAGFMVGFVETLSDPDPALDATPDIRQRIPAAMCVARRWLLYRLQPSPKPGGKARKIPFYANGQPRGETDTPADQAQLATLDQALAALKTGRYAGLGFALGPDGKGGCWQGVDFDGYSQHPEWSHLIADLPGYVEWSPSGDGLHAIGNGPLFQTLPANGSGIEAYAQGRFFTVTTNVVRANDPVDLGPYVRDRLTAPHRSGGNTATTPSASAWNLGDIPDYIKNYPGEGDLEALTAGIYPDQGLPETPANIARVWSALAAISASCGNAEWSMLLWAVASLGWDCGEDLLAGAVALEVVLEPSGTYGDALVGQLRRRGVAVYRVSPKRVHDAAEVYDGVPSLHDAKACELIGRLHLQGVSRVWEALGQERRELNAWLRRLEVSKGRLHAGLNRLEAHLSRHWPEVLGLLELSSVTLSELVAAYGGPAAVAADPVGAEALMRRVGRAGLSEEAIAAVLASAHENLGLPCVAAESDLLQWLAADNNATRRELHAIEQEIQRRVAASAVPARLGNVVGKVSAAVLVAAVGDPQDYPDAASYTKAIGLNLKERSSGKHKGQLKITKRGPAVARFYLYFAALRLIARDPEVRRWYDRQNARPGALKGKTIVTLMRKLAQALWHVGRGATFAVPRLFAPEPRPA